MTKEEWLKIGLQNGIVELEENEKIKFSDAYKQWFKSKCKINRGSTMDRIEVTYKRHYEKSALVEMYTSNITEKDIIVFFSTIIINNGALSQKEFERVYQIMHSVLVYLRDMDYEGVRLYDWDVIKRNIPRNKIITEKKNESALSKTIVTDFIHAVVIENIYPLKRSACLCLCLNFYLGLRIGELAALRFSDFDLARKVVKITHSDSKVYERNEEGEKVCLTYKMADTKTIDSVREIPLLPEAVYIYEAIKNHHSSSGYHSAFLVYDGADTIRIRSLDRTLRRLCSLCGINHFNSHVIRKTFATMLHHSNVPTRAISDLMGHSEMSTTEKNYILSFADNYDMYYQYMKDSLKYN